jgi:hypothetical protein
MRYGDFCKVISKEHLVKKPVQWAWLGKVNIITFGAFSWVDSYEIPSSRILS